MKFPTLSGCLRNFVRFVHYRDISTCRVALWDGVLHPQFPEELRASPYRQELRVPSPGSEIGMGNRAEPAIPPQPQSHSSPAPIAALIPAPLLSRSQSHPSPDPIARAPRAPAASRAPAPRAPAGPGDVKGADWGRPGEAWREDPPPRPSERGHGVRRPGGAHHRHERVLGAGRRRPALAGTQGAEPRVSDRGAAGTGNLPFHPPRVWGQAPAEAAPEP